MHFSLQTSIMAAATKATVSFDELLQKAQSCQLDLTTVLSVDLIKLSWQMQMLLGFLQSSSSSRSSQLQHHSWEQVLSSGLTVSGNSQAQLGPFWLQRRVKRKLQH